MTPSELAAELRNLRAQATGGKWYVNNQEFDSCLMDESRNLFARFENPGDAYLAVFIANHAEEIAKALEGKA